jgi:ketosteroid isomerase-like protein
MNQNPSMSLAFLSRSFLLAALFATATLRVGATPEEDKAAVAALDTAFQAAVERKDRAAAEKNLHPDYALLLGNGVAMDRKTYLDWEFKAGDTYEYQVEEPGTQTVRVAGDTAVVTALLNIKGTRGGKPMELRLWFSDVYVRTKDGWKYFLGQSSLPLPPAKAAAAKS